MRTEVRGGPRASNAIERFFLNDEKVEQGAQLIFSYLRAETKKNFQFQSAGDGGKWPGYTGSEYQYGIIKQKILGKQLGQRLLRWAPGMERLFPSVTKEGHPEQVAEINGRTIRFGTTVPYAANHQYGFGVGPKWAGSPKVKQRKFLTLGPRQVAEVRRIISRTVGI